MALNTNVTAETGAQALGNKVVVYQRLINFATYNVDSGDHIALFNLPYHSLVVAGQAELVATGTLATANFTLGKTTGTELLTSTNLDGTAGTCTPFTNTAPISFDNDAIDLAIDTANAVTGQVRVTAMVLLCDNFATPTTA